MNCRRRRGQPPVGAVEDLYRSSLSPESDSAELKTQQRIAQRIAQPIKGRISLNLTGFSRYPSTPESRAALRASSLPSPVSARI
jgi:hypothetical protein